MRAVARLRAGWYRGLMRWSPLLVLAAGYWIVDPRSVLRVVTVVLSVTLAALQPRCACHDRATQVEQVVEDWDAAFSAIMPDGQPPGGHRAARAA